MIRIYEWLQIRKRGVICFVIVFFILLLVYIFFHTAPKEFPLGQVVTITSGQSLQDIANTLYNAKIIKSPFIFRAYVIILGGEKRVIAGDYLLNQRQGPADL